MANFKHHEPCPNCGSKDNLARYDDDSGYCFGCNYYERGKPSMNQEEQRQHMVYNDPIQIESPSFEALAERKINAETCRKLGYRVAQVRRNGTLIDVQIADYKDDTGAVVASKIRYPNKSFAWTDGDRDKIGLWGKHLWKAGGKRVTVVEGEIDALTISQFYKNEWPVVSLPNGAGQQGKKSFGKDLEWLESFDEVVLFFDSDEPGIKTAKDCAMMLTPGKARMVRNFKYKDANEAWIAGDIQGIQKALWDAEFFHPDGIVDGKDLWDAISSDDDVECFDYPWEGLNETLFGMRKRELITFAAGTGVGKSTICRELAYHLLKNGKKVGYLGLEESLKKTGRNLMALELGFPAHKWHLMDKNPNDLRGAFELTVGSGNLIMYDHWGSMAPDRLLNQIKYMTKGMGCEYIVLDHLSIVVSAIAEGDERRMIDNTMTRLRSLVEECNCHMMLVSHLSRPSGAGHEEGGATSLSQLRGSAAIGQLSDGVVGLERNQQSETGESDVIKVRVLKNRFAGITGVAGYLEYNKATGRLSECVMPEVVDVP
jgi:twinkle protein